MSLTALPSLLGDDRDLNDLIGSRAAVLAVPDPARAFVLASLGQLSGRRPLVVVTPTSQDAERLAHDLRAYLGDHEVDIFPAWETLPFERVSPSVETMGRRLETMWHLSSGTNTPAVLVKILRLEHWRLGRQRPRPSV